MLSFSFKFLHAMIIIVKFIDVFAVRDWVDTPCSPSLCSSLKISEPMNERIVQCLHWCWMRKCVSSSLSLVTNIRTRNHSHAIILKYLDAYLFLNYYLCFVAYYIMYYIKKKRSTPSLGAVCNKWKVEIRTGLFLKFLKSYLTSSLWLFNYTA